MGTEVPLSLLLAGLLAGLLACGEGPPPVDAPAAPADAPAAPTPIVPQNIDKMDDPTKLELDCAADDGPSCFNLAVMYLTGGTPGIAEDPAAALAHFERACELGVEAACSNQAKLAERSAGEAGDAATRTAWADACDGGTANACVNLGRALKADEEYAAAARRFEQGCAIVSGRPCTDLGVLTLSGMGAGPDAVAALALFKKGCAGGDVAGCMNAARAYYIGEGVEKSDRMARQYLTTACQGGSASACERLAAITPLEQAQ